MVNMRVNNFSVIFYRHVKTKNKTYDLKPKGVTKYCGFYNRCKIKSCDNNITKDGRRECNQTGVGFLH